MARTHIPIGVRCQLWAKAGGRCEYPGCNRPLWKDILTQDEFNNAYIAHIVAVASDGPRGDPVLSPKLAADPVNLMLLCDSHHRLIDRDDVAGHTVEILTAIKQAHEQRIEFQTELCPEHRSEIICYQANIGPQPAPLHYRECVEAILEDNPLWIDAAEIQGMLFWLTGNCHIKWTQDANLQPSV